ncbi:hypothetical protein CPB86DRAFT_874435 [Serendipita vermifera]|nr:hypothetical protein CPB86DRAFT_874435 [Serendipita vermifera]
MLFSTLFVSISLATLQACGLSIPRDGGRLYDVGVISCTPLDGFPRPLLIKSTTSTEQDGQSTVPGQGVPVALVDNVLTQSYSAGSFTFQNCTSTFMNLTPSTDGTKSVYYGQVTTSSTSTECLTSYPGRNTPQNITTEECSVSDDSGLMLQFWKLTIDTADSPATATLDFVGKPNRYDIPGYYATDFVEKDGWHFPQINYVKDGTQFETPYQLNFE